MCLLHNSIGVVIWPPQDKEASQKEEEKKKECSQREEDKKKEASHKEEEKKKDAKKDEKKAGKSRTLSYDERSEKVPHAG